MDLDAAWQTYLDTILDFLACISLRGARSSSALLVESYLRKQFELVEERKLGEAFGHYVAESKSELDDAFVALGLRLPTPPPPPTGPSEVAE